MPAPQRSWVDVPSGTAPVAGTPAVNAVFLEELETYLESEVDGAIANVNTHIATAQAWVAVGTFTNSWVNAASRVAAAYYKDKHNKVWLKGQISTGTVSTTSTGVAFTLPTGYRPDFNRLFSIASRDGSGPVLGEAEVLTTGEVRINYGNNTLVSLDGICFRTV